MLTARKTKLYYGAICSCFEVTLNMDSFRLERELVNMRENEEGRQRARGRDGEFFGESGNVDSSIIYFTLQFN